MVTARCPCCGNILVVRVDGTFPRHQRNGPGQRNGRRCVGSLWLVEDEDVAA